jgi:uncharacterized membrane protein
MNETLKRVWGRVSVNPIFWVLIVITALICFISLFESGYPGYARNMYNLF